MALKKQNFAEGEIAIFDEACVYKRGEYWQFRLWLPKENKYARKSLRTRSESTAIERGKAAYLEIYGNLQQGKSYFSITTKEGVEKYLSFRKRDVGLDPLTFRSPNSFMRPFVRMPRGFFHLTTSAAVLDCKTH